MLSDFNKTEDQRFKAKQEICFYQEESRLEDAHYKWKNLNKATQDQMFKAL